MAVISPASLPILPDNYTFYEFQIAGHHHSKSGKYEQLGILVNKTSKRVLKPLQTQGKNGETQSRGEMERNFYSLVWETTKSDIDKTVLLILKSFVPVFYGVINLPINNRTFQFLELENLCAKYDKPCITDIKIGKKTRDPTTTDATDPDTTKYEFAAKHGFRFCGLIIYDTVSAKYVRYDKRWATEAAKRTGITNLIEIFFKKTQSLHKIIISSIVDKLKELRRFFETQKSASFYGSSLLITYEGSAISSEKLSEKNAAMKYFDVRMIDFSHTKFVKSCIDENYLFGLKNLITEIETYVNTLPN